MLKHNFINKAGKNRLYSDLDYDNVRRGCLTPKLFVYLISIFILITLILGAIFSLLINFNINHSFKGVGLLSVSQIFQESDNTSDVYSVSIYDYDLTTILKSLNIPDTRDLTAHVRTKNIKISGIYQKPLDLKLDIYVRPIISNNKVIVQLDDATVGGVRMIWLINDGMRQALASSIENYATGRINGKITDIVLDEGEMIIKITP